jgi:methionyl-tRNA synthetase
VQISSISTCRGPGRIEQRNGRIDRKQPVPEVTRHYFVLPQRGEDRVIDMVREPETIERAYGIRHRAVERGLDHRSVSRTAA